MPFVVLLVEDHDDTRAMCALGLSLSGYVVHQARDAAEALAFLQHDLPDIIVTDLSMPGMDGVEMCRGIRQMPVGRRLPILVITGHSRSPAFLRLADAGACAAASKPLAPDALAAMVERLLTERPSCRGCWEDGGTFTPSEFEGGITWWRRQPAREPAVTPEPAVKPESEQRWTPRALGLAEC